MAWYLGDIVVGWCSTKISASNSHVAWGISFGETITMPFLIDERLIWENRGKYRKKEQKDSGNKSEKGKREERGERREERGWGGSCEAKPELETEHYLLPHVGICMHYKADYKVRKLYACYIQKFLNNYLLQKFLETLLCVSLSSYWWKCSEILLFQLHHDNSPTNLFEGEGRRLSTANLSDGHPLAVDGFNGDGDEGAQRVRA